MPGRDASLRSIISAAEGLRRLCDKVAFVGGTTLTSYIDDPGADDVRHTDDVDCIIEVVGPSGFSQLNVKLRGLSFAHHPTSAILYRWLFKGITADIMPTLGAR
jgi:hypothetical protein